MNTEQYLINIEYDFQKNKNKVIAHGQKNYMKNQFDFFGIKTPLRRKIQKIYMDKAGLPNKKELSSIVKILWNKPQRECQYFAQELVEKYKNDFVERDMVLLEYMIINKSWWDTIDMLAPHFIGQILKDYPELQDEYISSWVDSDNIWINRTAILFQLKYKEDTDFQLFKSIVERLKTKNEFFVKKAIGWGLREYSKTEPDQVEQYIKYAKLQPLSEKEGMKVIMKNKK